MVGITKFPAALDSHTGGDPYGFAELVNLKQTTLVGDHSATAVTLNVVSTAGFPSRGVVVVARGGVNEVVHYTGQSGGTSFTGCTRGAQGTLAVPHINGEVVASARTAANHNDLAAAIAVIEAKLGTGASAPASNLALISGGADTSQWGALSAAYFANRVRTLWLPASRFRLTSGTPSEEARLAAIHCWLLGATATGGIGTSVALPADVVDSPVQASIYWCPTDAAAGNVVFNMQTTLITPGAGNLATAHVPAGGAGTAYASPAVLDRLTATVHSSDIFLSTEDPGEFSHITVERLGAAAGDTYAAAIRFLGVLLSYTADM